MSKKSKKRKQTAELEVAQVQVAEAPAWMKLLDRDLYAIPALIVVWLIPMVLIDPRGNFPMVDDWLYGKCVFQLLHAHQFHMAGLITMTLIAQVLWGALFCLLFGASFTVLRISTLVLGLGGLLALYGLMREAGTPRWIAFVGCVVLALNPFYLSLSYSFMTDVPFTAISLMAIYAWARALRHGSTRMIVLGTALACAATLIRQIGIFLPMGFGLAYLAKEGVRTKSLLKAILPAAITLAILLAYTHWLKHTHRLPAYFNIHAIGPTRFFTGGPSVWMRATVGTILRSYVYLGLLLLPFSILILSRQWQALTVRRRKMNSAISLTSAVVVMGVLTYTRDWMPLDRVTGDYIIDFGIGPPRLRDVWVEKIPNYPMMPEGFWIWVTVFSVLAGGLLLWHLLAAGQSLTNRRREPNGATDRALLVLLLAVTAMNLALFVPLSAFVYFDRYVLVVIPLLIVVLAVTTKSARGISRLCLAGSLLTLLLIGSFSVGGTHDFMAWNRLRWHAAGALIRTQHVSPQQIDGGDEFNGWYDYDEKTNKMEPFDDYIITFGPTPGYNEMKKYTFHRWMPPGEGTIYVLSKSMY